MVVVILNKRTNEYVKFKKVREISRTYNYYGNYLTLFMHCEKRVYNFSIMNKDNIDNYEIKVSLCEEN